MGGEIEVEYNQCEAFEKTLLSRNKSQTGALYVFYLGTSSWAIVGVSVN